MPAWSCKTEKFDFLAFFWKSDTLRENFQFNILFRKDSSRHWSTCCVQISWNFGRREIGKVVRYLPDKNTISPGSPALATAWIAPKICQGHWTINRTTGRVQATLKAFAHWSQFDTILLVGGQWNQIFQASVKLRGSVYLTEIWSTYSWHWAPWTGAFLQAENSYNSKVVEFCKTSLILFSRKWVIF